MQTGFVIGAVILIVILYFLYRQFIEKDPIFQIAQQIKLEELESIMDKLINGQLEFDLFGITSDGVDCIYFVKDNSGKINIEFEVKTSEQIQFADKIKSFSDDNGYSIIKKTYGNKPDYSELKEAPVYKIDINADKEIATKIGVKIMNEIFENNESTKFDVVP